jgi:hypothetical protein
MSIIIGDRVYPSETCQIRALHVRAGRPAYDPFNDGVEISMDDSDNAHGNLDDAVVSDTDSVAAIFEGNMPRKRLVPRKGYFKLPAWKGK